MSGEDQLDAKMRRLAEICEMLEQSRLSLEQSMTLYEEGIVLGREIDRRLKETEARIEVLTQDGRTVKMEDIKR